MPFEDVCFNFTINSTFSIKKQYQRFIPKNLIDYNSKNNLFWFEDVFQNKKTAIKCILGLYYKKSKDDLSIFNDIISQCKHYIAIDYDKKTIEMYHLSNLVYFNKISLEEAMSFFYLDELEVYGY